MAHMLLLGFIAFMGWYFYGIDLIVKSDQKCGYNMYILLYVLFWIWISVLGIAVLLC